jgi:hypothetical protein
MACSSHVALLRATGTAASSVTIATLDTKPKLVVHNLVLTPPFNSGSRDAEAVTLFFVDRRDGTDIFAVGKRKSQMRLP